MAKQRRYEGKKAVGNRTVKLRIGTRKNGRSANEMTDEELRKHLNGRYHSNALKVLMARNAALKDEVIEEETPETA